MSLSRSPSPRPGGGWASPGLTVGTSNSRGTSPGRGVGDTNGGSSPFHPNGSSAPGAGISWTAAKAKSDQVRGYPSFSTRNNGFFSRQRRKISASLPRFRVNAALDPGSKAPPSRWARPGGGSLPSRICTLLANLLRRTRIRLLLLSISTFVLWLVLSGPIMETYRSSSWGSGQNVVIIVPTNIGGGVMEWKGAREWAIERNSLANKRNYANRWGYQLETPNMVTKKRYAHEWRESWEKVDVIRQAMRKYPKSEWFWWIDLNSFIMEPSKSLEQHLFHELERKTYRDINLYNPLNITHPSDRHYVDPLALSPVGDGKASSINMIVPQDCDGFNLGSFLIRRSAWTDRLLDIWWDPVHYEQKHMAWEHKEQDVLEHLYDSQPWVRPHVAFVPNRRMNSFPPGACGGTKHLNPYIHYQKPERDFVVNMAGCQWGRDCWSELYHYRQLSHWLNRNPWERFKDGISLMFKNIFTSKNKKDQKDQKTKAKGKKS